AGPWAPGADGAGYCLTGSSDAAATAGGSGGGGSGGGVLPSTRSFSVSSACVLAWAVATLTSQFVSTVGANDDAADNLDRVDRCTDEAWLATAALMDKHLAERWRSTTC
ncbi:unnamed protein product, partial [Ectocarpus sp. 12 AP-2014]